MAPSSRPTAYSQNKLRVKPSHPPSGSCFQLHGIDHAAALFTPLNLFFKPSAAGPTQLHDFANSLRDVLDRLPLVAGSIRTVQDAQGVKSLQFIEDGRGVDLVWEESTTACTHPLVFVDVTPRPITVYLDDPNQTLLMVKFTKFACGTLAMGVSMSHMFADCTSYIDFLKEWARVSRGGLSEALTVTSWERNPGTYFSPPIPGVIPHGMYMPNGPASSLLPSRPITVSNFFFTWDSLRELKTSCAPASDASAWVSTGDCVGAVLWRALTIARKDLLKPGRDVHLYMAVDGRDRSKRKPDALKYFGNLVTPITITLSQSALLNGSLASVSLAIRCAIQEQLTDINCANMLALFDLVKFIPKICDNNLGDSRITNWAKYPLVGDKVDFGGGAPFWETTAQFPAGQLIILPQRDGYLGSLMIESNWDKSLQTNHELLAYAKALDT